MNIRFGAARIIVSKTDSNIPELLKLEDVKAAIREAHDDVRITVEDSYCVQVSLENGSGYSLIPTMNLRGKDKLIAALNLWSQKAPDSKNN